MTFTWSDGLPGVIVTMPEVIGGMVTSVQPARSSPYSTTWVVAGAIDRSLRSYSKVQTPPGDFLSSGNTDGSDDIGAPPRVNSIRLTMPSKSGSSLGPSLSPAVRPCAGSAAQVLKAEPNAGGSIAIMALPMLSPMLK